MSTINQTLRALDARGQSAGPPSAALRPVAGRARRWGPAVIIAAAAVAAGVGAGWLAGRPAAPAVGAAAEPQPPVVEANAMAASPAEPSSPEPAPSVEVAAAADVPEAVPAQNPAALQLMRLARSETLLPVEPAARNPSPAPQIRKQLASPAPDEAADELYRKAVALLQKGRETQARAVLEEAVALQPRHVPARQTLVALLSESGRLDDAEAVLRAGRVAVPDHAWFALSLARLQAGRGETQQAIATLQESLGVRGVDADHHATLAALLVQVDRHGEAAQHYRQALASRPGESNWWLGLGLALSAQGQLRDARGAYERAVATGKLPQHLADFARAKLAGDGAGQ